ncbi:MAG: D-glycero-beta-D-manno-heptose-7-phosphate kinase [Candidatus Margulisbacteria bacterium]|nr:D-glycero-beta-D-manno-heptose-7-phosphate kinase [Candidatus Margulisiibacteriota bacterium]MBU1022160.1 D-glycero-beta-D-manno-heptose-7-phosphate kinase [Candidatus Margulisiibacteriota bacterium]MBU1729401.1 D-glycero-beta-D-manno-heptose-7-phosphate kinase [Candidatus Margulisiibacteriota bacterium]MBU1955674.1 D-glycero-beta-D-manno-heptose-7-phosphate kinase [Candidatus Margulisiibacteriota bacterium]
MEHLKTFISKFKNKKILILGDLMLDEHIWSKVSRISPEAPVPIAAVQSISLVPGGCGNVAANVKTLGGTPIILSVIGKDSSGTKLITALKKLKISTKHILVDNVRPTILKSRIIANSQQVVRVDRENKEKIEKNTQKRVLAAIKKLIRQCDAVVISDYGKGMVTPELAQSAIRLAKKYKKPITVDPKGTDYRKYRSATIITPNLKEAKEATKIFEDSDAAILNMGKQLLAKNKTKYILITRGKDGMSLFSSTSKARRIQAVPREVFDITGAGDTVIATLTLALSTGAEILDATTLANFAASVAISKIGTTPVAASELKERLQEHSFISQKVRNRKDLSKLVNQLKESGKTIVFTNGCFDLLHLGHVRYLKEAKKLGDILIIGLNSDASVKKLKGAGRPYTGQLERAEILAALEPVDYVTIFAESTPLELLKVVKPHVHVKGGDYQKGNLPEAKIVQRNGGKVVVVSLIKGKSTTKLIEKVRRGK